VLTEHDTFLKAFKDLEGYSLSIKEAEDPQNGKCETWTALHKKYTAFEPASVNLTPNLEPDKDKIKYPAIAARCKIIARHNVTNSYLNMIAGETKSHVSLMPYMDMAYELTMKKEAGERIKTKGMELFSIL